MITYYLYDEDGYFIDAVELPMNAAAPARSTLAKPADTLVKPRRFNMEWIEG